MHAVVVLLKGSEMDSIVVEDEMSHDLKQIFGS